MYDLIPELTMERNEIAAIIEAILLVADRPVSIDQLAELFGTEIDRAALRSIMASLREEYAHRSFQLIEIAKGYRFATRPEHAEWIKRFLKLEKRTTLSRPALETLSIIAYKQPITKVEIEAIRGVDVSGVLETLLKRNLIRVLGRKKVVGRPLLYGSTRKFLEYFGLRDLSDLPPVEMLRQETGQEEATPQETLPLSQQEEAQSPAEATQRIPSPNET